MQQRQEQQDQTDQTLLLIHGSAEPSTSAHQWDSLHPDTPSFDLWGEVHPEEEVVADFQEETQEEEVGSQVEEILEDTLPNKEIYKEDHQETDL